MIEFRTTIESGIAVIALDGKVFESEAFEFKHHLQGVLGNGEIQKVVINLDNVPQIDSSGLGAFVGAHKLLVEKKIQFVLCHLRPKLVSLFEETRLDQVLTIYPTQEDALEKIK